MARSDLEKVTIPELSIIIPTLNEEDKITSLLQDLGQQQDLEIEIIVSDGGSTDRTCAAAETAGASVLRNSGSFAKGRAAQMNTGAEKARGDYLLFLHADSSIKDSQLLANALKDLNHLSKKQNHPLAGHFPLKFAPEKQSRKPAYAFYERKSALNRKNTTNGDQGFLLSKSFLNDLGGFNPKLHFLEDQILAEQIRSHGKWITLPGELATSARRFEREGTDRRMIASILIMAFHDIGYQKFFEKAPGLYCDPEQDTKLELVPIFRCASSLLRKERFERSVQLWRGLGRYSRENAWQLFFLLDLIVNDKKAGQNSFFLKIHDRVWDPLTKNPIGNFLATILTFNCFHLVWGFYEIKERYGPNSLPPER